MSSFLVSGLGAITPIGTGVDENWERLVNGYKPPIDSLNPELCTRLGLKARLFRPLLLDSVIKNHGRVEQLQYDRASMMALAVVQQALSDATNKGFVHLVKTGVFVGTGMGSAVQIIENSIEGTQDLSRLSNPFQLLQCMTSTIASAISVVHGLSGPSLSSINACASGATALSIAMDQLRLGRIDRAVVVGVDYSCDNQGYIFKSFDNLGVLTRRSVDTYHGSMDQDADGFLIAEGGAACVVLDRETPEMEKSSWAKLVDIEYFQTVNHLIKMDEDIDQYTIALQNVLSRNYIDPNTINHINLHATGTKLNDSIETAILNRLFSPYLSTCATKNSTGHMLGASALFEIVVTCQSLKYGTVPPTIHVSNPVHHSLSKHATPLHEARALSFSFGFGGANVITLLEVADA